MPADMSGLGTARQDVLADLRVFPVRRYLILYREVGGGTEILRVIHGARRWETEVKA